MSGVYQTFRKVWLFFSPPKLIENLSLNSVEGVGVVFVINEKLRIFSLQQFVETSFLKKQYPLRLHLTEK